MVFVVAAIAGWYRLPAAVRNTFWAEDAAVFSERALDPGQLPWSVFTSYDGYVHALPQAIAFVLWYGVPIPVELMAAAFTAAACVVAAGVAAAIYIVTGEWGLNVPGRLLLALTTVLVPGLTFEVTGNIANVHWFLLWLAPFLFLARPTRWWSAAIIGVVAFLVLTSEVQSALFAPLLLWRISERRRWPMIGAALVGAIVQATAVLSGGRETWGQALPRVISILDGYVLQVPLMGLSGTQQSATAIVGSSGWSAAFAALVPFAICGVWWAWRSRRRAVLAAGIFVASLAIWTAGYALNQASIFDFAESDRSDPLGGPALLRYAIVPLMLLYALAGLAVGSRRLPPRSVERGIATVVIALCVCGFAVNYRVDVPTLRMAGPTWSTGLAAAREECAQLGGDDDVVIPIAPVPYWTFTIECGRIER